MERFTPFSLMPFTPNLSIETMEEIAMSNTINTATNNNNKTTTKINWKVRFKNRVFLAAFASLCISFIYGMLDLFEIVPGLPEGRTVEFIQSVLTVMGLLGIITDRTTAGIGDSERALGYEEPWNDTGDGDSDEDEYIGLTD